MCHFPTVMSSEIDPDAVDIVDKNYRSIKVPSAMLPVLVGELVGYMTPEQKTTLLNRLSKDLALVYSVTFTEPPDRPDEDE